MWAEGVAAGANPVDYEWVPEGESDGWNRKKVAQGRLAPTLRRPVELQGYERSDAGSSTTAAMGRVFPVPAGPQPRRIELIAVAPGWVSLGWFRSG